MDLEKISSFEDRLNKTAELVHQKTKDPKDLVSFITEIIRFSIYDLSIQKQLAATANSFIKKIIAAHHYKPSTKINADVMLIKPTENYAKLQEDYGLTDVSLRNV